MFVLPRKKAAAMLTLASKLKRDDGLKGSRASATASDSTRRVSVRDRLLVKEVAELEANLPCTCKVHFPDPNKLHCFQLTVTPDEGYYQGGKFQFETEVPDAYNMVMSVIGFKIDHKKTANHREKKGPADRSRSVPLRPAAHLRLVGLLAAPHSPLRFSVCFSLLREHSIDGTGWAPTRTLKDLLNFDDPLNIEAAEHHLRDKEDFRNKVEDYIKRYAR
ncbi:hypothetical protein E5288_WYG003272 [Bos mutus]|uniref:UBC core domain-containing protein n=1 Tax=Bos mutus TaxID=72004 RepID=A0A6B0S9B9_9CETA|nr:hypothetical protein [Bos mutus]